MVLGAQNIILGLSLGLGDSKHHSAFFLNGFGAWNTIFHLLNMLGGLIISSFPCSRFSYMLIDLNHFPWGFTWLGGPHPHPHPHPHPYSHSRSHYYPQSHLNSHPNPYIHHTPPHSQFHPYTYSHLYSHSQTLLLPLHSHLFTLISSLSSLQSHRSLLAKQSARRAICFIGQSRASKHWLDEVKGILLMSILEVGTTCL
jgi:hypothetical protein